MQKDTIVCYHAHCPDGFGAAWAASLRFGASADYIPVNHGDEPPNILTGQGMFVLDYSWPRRVTERLAEQATPFMVIDHHKTAEADLAGLSYVKFDMNHSGATMAWDFFVGRQPAAFPFQRKLVEYLEDQDLWKFELPFSKEINAAIWSYSRDFDTWSELSKRVDSLAVEGQSILRYQERLIDDQVERVRTLPVGGYPVPVVNATTLFSQTCDRLLKMFPQSPFSAYYFDREDGKRQWGARSRSGFDVSEVAKKLGGGGHAQAAGWQEVL